MKSKSLRLKTAARAALLLLLIGGMGMTRAMAQGTTVLPNYNFKVGDYLYLRTIESPSASNSNIGKLAITHPAKIVRDETSPNYNLEPWAGYDKPSHLNNVTGVELPVPNDPLVGDITLQSHNYIITQIDDSAFYNIQDAAFIGDSWDVLRNVTRIGDYAYYGAYSNFYHAFIQQLFNLFFGSLSTLQYIGDHAFEEAYGIGSVGTMIIPNSVTYIGEKAFYHAFNDIDWEHTPVQVWAVDTKLTIGTGVTHIGADAFQWRGGAEGWWNIEFNATNCTSGAFAFRNCAVNHHGPGYCVLKIGENVTNIPESLFEQIEGGYSSYYTGSYIYVPIKLYQGDDASNPYDNFKNVRHIGRAAFRGCTGIDGTIKIGWVSGQTNEIDAYAFTNCTGLERVEMGYYTEISTSAFNGCTSLESVVLPENLQTIGYEAFYDCENLVSVYSPSTTPAEMVSHPFSSLSAGATRTAYVPSCAVQDYENSWKDNTDYFSDVEGYYTGDCCYAPTDLTLSSCTSTTATLSWNGANDQKWILYCYDGNEGEFIINNMQVPAGTTTYALTNLEPGHVYLFIVIAECNTNLRSDITFTTDGCSAPTNLTVSNVTSSSATLTWSSGSTGTGWKVFYRVYGSQSENYYTVPAGTNTYTLTGLESNTEYVCRVAAVCNEGLFATEDFLTDYADCMSLYYQKVSSVSSDDVVVLVDDSQDKVALNTMWPIPMSASAVNISVENGSRYIREALPTNTAIFTVDGREKYTINCGSSSSPKYLTAQITNTTSGLEVKVYYSSSAMSGGGNQYSDSYWFMERYGGGTVLYIQVRSTTGPVNYYLTAEDVDRGDGTLVYGLGMESDKTNPVYLYKRFESTAPAIVLSNSDITNVTSSQATLSWNKNCASDEWQILLKDVTNNNDERYISVTGNPSKVLENLNPETTYTVEIRTKYGDGDNDYTGWSNQIQFTTPGLNTFTNQIATDDSYLWTTDGNWSYGRAPLAGESAIIDGDCYLGAQPAANLNLTVNAGKTLEIASAVTSMGNSTITNNGMVTGHLENATITNNATFDGTVQNALVHNHGTFTLSGYSKIDNTIFNYGTLNINQLLLEGSTYPVINEGGTMTINTPGSFNMGPINLWTKTETASGSTTTTPSTLTISGSSSAVTNSGLYFDGSGHSVTVTGGAQLTTSSITSTDLTNTGSTGTGTLTIGSGSIVTVTGSFSTSVRASIQDGGQLVHNTAGVRGSLEKNIVTSTSSAPTWYTISTPFEYYSPNMPSGNYYVSNISETMQVGDASVASVYEFDQSKHLEWRYVTPGRTMLQQGHGYLYSSTTYTDPSTGVTMDPNVKFQNGFLQPSNVNVEVDLAYMKPENVTPVSGDEQTASQDKDYMCGWNFVGNPYPCNAYINMSFYKMETENGTQGFDHNNAIVPTLSESTISPCEAVFVVATAEGQKVTFSRTVQSGGGTGGGTTGGRGVIVLSMEKAAERGTARVDKAIVSFREGDELPKLVLNPNKSKLYIPQNGKDYAIAVAEPMGVLPVNFEAFEDGNYTLSVTPEEAEFSYLHLIDNLTGADVDLLKQPAYTFEASMMDYPSRFKLVFSKNEVSEDLATEEPFAFYDGSAWVLATDGNATVQLVDVMGRVIVNTNGAHTISTNGMATGVYVLRLINGNDVKTQKIVVR